MEYSSYAKDGERDIFAELVKSKASQKSKSKIRSDIPPTSSTVSKNTAQDSSSDEEGQLTVDVFQDDKNLYVQSTVAGVEPDDLEIHITRDSVTIRGTRERSQSISDDNFFYQECFWGTFSRSVTLPQEIDSDSSSASFKNGVLTITMPKLSSNPKRAKGVKVTKE